MFRQAFLISAATVCLATGIGLASAQTPQLSAPGQAQKALTAMSRVVDHTQRLIAAKNYNQLPREDEEFMDGSDALKKSIAGDPPAFKTKVEVLLDRADANSKDLAAASSGSDFSKLSRLHEDLANSVRQIVSAFPNDAQPSAANLSEERQEERVASSSGQNNAGSRTLPHAEALSAIPASSTTVTNYYKQNVYDPSDSKIGEIKDVLVGREGKVVAFIVSVGGFLGIGEKDVAVPFSAINATEKSGTWYLTMNATKDSMKEALSYSYDKAKATWVPST
jgi:sporulation protein YlmC with PRC-barrel domain